MREYKIDDIPYIDILNQITARFLKYTEYDDEPSDYTYGLDGLDKNKKFDKVIERIVSAGMLDEIGRKSDNDIDYSIITMDGDNVGSVNIKNDGNKYVLTFDTEFEDGLKWTEFFLNTGE